MARRGHGIYLRAGAGEIQSPVPMKNGALYPNGLDCGLSAAQISNSIFIGFLLLIKNTTMARLRQPLPGPQFSYNHWISTQSLGRPRMRRCSSIQGVNN